MKRYKEEYEVLKRKIEEANFYYYTMDKPIYTDEEYDKIFDDIKELEEKFPELIEGKAISKNVGGTILDGFVRKQHTVPLLSLDKAQNKERVEKFIKDTNSDKYVLEWKYDGLAFVARFEDGKFIEARTRGNGVEGEVITEQVRTIRSFPNEINLKGILEISGEIYMPYSSYERYNNRQLELAEIESKKIGVEAAAKKYQLLQNPRNGAAGAIRQLDLSITKERELEAALFNLLVAENLGVEVPESQTETKEFLDNLGFNTTIMLLEYKINEVNELLDALDKCEATRKNLPFEVDGLVLKVDNKNDQEEIGYTNSFPKWAIAYKFEAVEKQTTLKDVIWEVGRTGRVTPVAIFEEINFDGVKVTRATLNNPNYIKVLGIKEGSQLVVRRSNDVIPQVTSVLGVNDGNEINIPQKCPICDNVLRYDAPLLFCDNKSGCGSQIESRIKHFCSRDAMDISGLSDKTIKLLIENNKIEDASDLYDLKENDFEGLEGFGPKKTRNLLDAIEKSKRVEWSKFIYALGMPNIGRSTSRLLAKRYKNLEELYLADIDDLIVIDTIAEKTAAGIIDFLEDYDNKVLIGNLFDKGVIPFVEESNNESNNKLSGKSFVITGSLNQSRQVYKDRIEKQGGIVRGSVSKNTDFVLAGENAGSKLKRAKELGVRILTEEEFENML